VKKIGGTPTLVHAYLANESLAKELLVDSTYVYMSMITNESIHPSLSRSKKDGSGFSNIDYREFHHWAIAEGSIYYDDDGGADFPIKRFDPVQPYWVTTDLGTALQGGCWAGELALDADYVYYVDANCGGVYKVSRCGGLDRQLAAGVAPKVSFASSGI